MIRSEEEFSEDLYAIDVYIHQAIVQDDVVDPHHEIMAKKLKQKLKPSCLIGFRLWNFPLLYIEPKFSDKPVMEEEFFLPSGETIAKRIANEGYHQFQFHTGKSCLFTMSKDDLYLSFRTSPLYVFVFDYNDSLGRPVLVGSLSIPLVDFKVPEGIDKNHLVSGQFTLQDSNGFDIGVVDMDVRLRLLDSANLPDFSNQVHSQTFHSSQRASILNSSSVPHFTRRPFTAPPTQVSGKTLISVSNEFPVRNNVHIPKTKKKTKKKKKKRAMSPMRPFDYISSYNQFILWRNKIPRTQYNKSSLFAHPKLSTSIKKKKLKN